MVFKLKRAYEKAECEDGRRILVGRLWPCGLSKESAMIDMWANEVAPSNDLRKWFQHDSERWSEFHQRYRGDLLPNRRALEQLMAFGERGVVTLIYAAKDKKKNNAVVLRAVLEEILRNSMRRKQ